MKKSFLFILILLCTISLVGCGSNGSNGTKKKKAKGDGYIVQFDETDIFDEYETKKISKLNTDKIYRNIITETYSKSELEKLDKDLSFKEIRTETADGKKGLSVAHIIYNNSDKTYILNFGYRFKYADGDYTSDQRDEVIVPAHSVGVAGGLFRENAVEFLLDDVKIYESNKQHLGYDDFTFEKYTKEPEAKYDGLKIYFTYNGSGTVDLVETNLYCIKDGKLVHHYPFYPKWSVVYALNDAGDDSDLYAEINKKGQKTIAGYDTTLDIFAYCDSFVYTIEGTYK